MKKSIFLFTLFIFVISTNSAHAQLGYCCCECGCVIDVSEFQDCAGVCEAWCIEVGVIGESSPTSDCFGTACYVPDTIPPDLCPENLLLAEVHTTLDSIFEASNNISSTEMVMGTANIEYSAGEDIDLNPGFMVELGAMFHAYILGCSPDSVSVCQENLLLSDTHNSFTSMFEAYNNITSTEVVTGASNIEYSAGVDIDLNAGFCVDPGAEFHAYILGCSPPLSSIVSEPVHKISADESNADLFVLKYNLPKSAMVGIQLFDGNGRSYAQVAFHNYNPAGSHEFEIDKSSLKPGIYFCKIIVGKKVAGKKFIVQ